PPPAYSASRTPQGGGVLGAGAGEPWGAPGGARSGAGGSRGADVRADRGHPPAPRAGIGPSRLRQRLLRAGGVEPRPRARLLGPGFLPRRLPEPALLPPPRAASLSRAGLAGPAAPDPPPCTGARRLGACGVPVPAPSARGPTARGLGGRRPGRAAPLLAGASGVGESRLSHRGPGPPPRPPRRLGRPRRPPLALLGTHPGGAGGQGRSGLRSRRGRAAPLLPRALETLWRGDSRHGRSLGACDRVGGHARSPRGRRQPGRRLLSLASHGLPGLPGLAGRGAARPSRVDRLRRHGRCRGRPSAPEARLAGPGPAAPGRRPAQRPPAPAPAALPVRPVASGAAAGRGRGGCQPALGARPGLLVASEAP